MILNNKSLFIFDLDDTLVLEQDYVLSGFHAVAAHIAFVCPLSKDEIHQFLLFTFANEGRLHIFDKLMRRYPCIAQQIGIDNLVSVYRLHNPELIFIDGVSVVLRRLRDDGKKIAVVTDGHTSMQMRKTAALRLDAYVDSIIYCWDIGAPKPDPAGFVKAIEVMDATIGESVIIGDNPFHDIQPGALLGIDTVRVLQGRFSSLPDMDGFPACCHGASLKTIFEEHYGY